MEAWNLLDEKTLPGLVIYFVEVNARERKRDGHCEYTEREKQVVNSGTRLHRAEILPHLPIYTRSLPRLFYVHLNLALLFPCYSPSPWPLTVSLCHAGCTVANPHNDMLKTLKKMASKHV